VRTELRPIIFFEIDGWVEIVVGVDATEYLLEGCSLKASLNPIVGMTLKVGSED
jgi:hypothetical protein